MQSSLISKASSPGATENSNNNKTDTQQPPPAKTTDGRTCRVLRLPLDGGSPAASANHFSMMERTSALSRTECHHFHKNENKAKPSMGQLLIPGSRITSLGPRNTCHSCPSARASRAGRCHLLACKLRTTAYGGTSHRSHRRCRLERPPLARSARLSASVCSRARGPTSERTRDHVIPLPPNGRKARAIWETHFSFQTAFLEIQKAWGGSEPGNEKEAM